MTCNSIEEIKSHRPECSSHDGRHTWIVYSGGYTVYKDDDEDTVLKTYGRCRVCHDCDYIEEHIRSS